MSGVESRERWLVEHDGRILVQAVHADARHGYLVPMEVTVGERTFKFVEVSEGVEVYEEQE